jgi:hypothetical protein
MTAVMIRCPITEELVPTGLDISFEEYEAEPEPEPEPTRLLVDCPACGEDHEWAKGDALPDE